MSAYMFLGVAENMTEPIPSGGPINDDSTVEPGMAVHKKLFCLLGCFSVASKCARKSGTSPVKTRVHASAPQPVFPYKSNTPPN